MRDGMLKVQVWMPTEEKAAAVAAAEAAHITLSAFIRRAARAAASVNQHRAARDLRNSKTADADHD